MSLPVVLRRKAQAEFDEALDWYERQQAGLGVEFADRVQAVFDRISATPEVHALVYRDVRKALVRQFPYRIRALARECHATLVAVDETLFLGF